MALVIAPLTTAVMSAIGVERSGIASGVNNAVSRTAGLLAIAVLNLVIVTIFSHVFESAIAALHLTPTVQNELIAQRTRLASVQVPPGLGGTMQAVIHQAIAEAFVSGFRVVMLISSALALGSSLVAAWLIEGKGIRDVVPRLRLRARGRSWR
jgi:hypothetical protein